MKVLEPKTCFDLSTWEMQGEDVRVIQKVLSEVKGIFRNDQEVDESTLLYTVYSLSDETKEDGNVQLGVSVLEPLTVNGEYNMTRGHKHENESCSEIYLGLAGKGLLILSGDSENRIEEVFPGSIHFIKGSVAHRLVNIGSSKLKVGASWSVNAGHNYDVSFKYRIFESDSGVRIEKVKEINEK